MEALVRIQVINTGGTIDRIFGPAQILWSQLAASATMGGSSR
jgi:hypothetical protein